jgi:solute:Na+ symporter, SSS family
VGSYAIHNFILYVPNEDFGGQTYYQHWGLPWLHYIDVMVIVLVSSVIVSLIINRLVFGNRATFIFSAAGRFMHRSEEAALDAEEVRG